MPHGDSSSDYWYPICEDCDTDAVTLRLRDGAWWFYCDRHSSVTDKTIQQVRDGLRPLTQDSAWNAAYTAIQGVLKPDEDEIRMRQLIAEETGS